MLLHTEHVKKLPGYHALFELEPRYRRAHCFESRLRLHPEQLRHLLGIVAEMEREVDGEPPGYEYTVLALFMQMVSFLCRCYSDGSHPTARSLLRMGNVISYLEANYDEPIRLEDLREMAHLSNSALLKHFKEATGMPPMEYLLRVRIARAIELIHDSTVTITEAAFSVGFTDSNYFSRQFRRVMKITPSEYRTRTRRAARQAEEPAG
jgi:AraC-like DNA-binding protein